MDICIPAFPLSVYDWYSAVYEHENKDIFPKINLWGDDIYSNFSLILKNRIIRLTGFNRMYLCGGSIGSFFFDKFKYYYSAI